MPLSMILAVAALAEPGPRMPGADFLVGRWRCSGHFLPSRRPLSSHITFAIDPSDGSLRKVHRDRPPSSYVANEVWSASPVAGLNRATILSATIGARWYTTPGWQGSTLTWTRMVSPGEPAERFAYTRLDAETMRVDWFIDRNGGGLELGDTLRCSRTADRAAARRG